MNIRMASNQIGSCSVSFCYDQHSLETWFETHVAVYTRDDGEKETKGFYKKYQFRTLKAASRKFDEATEKYGIH